MNKKMKTKTLWSALIDNNCNNIRKSTSKTKMISSSTSSTTNNNNNNINNNDNKNSVNNTIINDKCSSNNDINNIDNNHKNLSSNKSSSDIVMISTPQTEISTNKKTKTTTTTTTTTTTKTTAILMVRPNTLNVTREGQNAETRAFIREALNAWRTKARCNVVPAERLQELFNELQFSPSEKQISEMLQTAKVFARKGSRQLNGLTFGEFCVLAADLKRFRACNISSSNNSKTLSSLTTTTTKSTTNAPDINSIENSCCTTVKTVDNSNGNKTSSTSSPITKNKNYHRTNSQAVKDHQELQSSSSSSLESSPLTAGTSTVINNTIGNSQTVEANNAPEVFLGGSCNPTTWRADVAIPTLERLGISFYNPQVSDWTPDLIELEHRAKEKARVLFFVMDSETRASAGAIEAAHIAGQNSRQLVLVLHPYKPDQCILNEPISPQEYLDLSRNQQLLRELVTRRGLPVLDNIQQGLQRTKAILAGIREPPSNIASVLIVVRGAFDRVVDSLDDEITIKQCQRALSFLGYANSLITMDNLKSIILSHKEETLDENKGQSLVKPSSSCSKINNSTKEKEIRINFDEFCVIAAYLSVLQQEIYESGCISPIKGIDVHPPPIFLANMQEGIHHNRNDEGFCITTTYSKQILRTSSCSCVPDDRHNYDLYRNRDSGTSSPQPTENLKSKYVHIGKRSKISVNIEYMPNGETAGEESDSNDSVFSSGSSINSNFCDNLHGIEFRDVYLGGSCYLRSRWRQDNAIPYLQSKGITYHLPALHESILPSQLKEGLIKTGDNVNCEQQRNGKKTKTRRKERNSSSKNHADQNCDNNDIEYIQLSSSSSSLALRPNLFNPALLDSSRVLLFVITNETRSLAPMTLAAHCIGLMYNVVLCVQMLPDFCIIGNERLTAAAIKDYNRGRAYLIDLAKRQGVPVFNDLKSALDCTIEKVKACNSRNSV